MEIEGGFYGSFGRTDRRVALLYVRVPLPGGCGTAARVLADFRQSNDNITEPDALGLTDIRTLGSTAQVSYEPNDRLMATVGAEWTRNDVEIVIREIPNQAFPLIERATTKHLDTDYHGLGVLFENVRGPAVGVEPFLTPGHPRRLTAGMRIRLPG